MLEGYITLMLAAAGTLSTSSSFQLVLWGPPLGDREPW